MTFQDIINEALKHIGKTTVRADMEAYNAQTKTLKNYIPSPCSVKKRLTIKDRMMFDAYEIMNGRGSRGNGKKVKTITYYN